MFIQPVKRNYRNQKIMAKIVTKVGSFQTNVIFAEMLFGCMKNYSFAYSGMKLSGPIIQAIKLNVPHIEDFLLSRCCLSQN